MSNLILTRRVVQASKSLRWLSSQNASQATTNNTSSATKHQSSSSASVSLIDRLQELWSDRSGTSEILTLKEQVTSSSQAFDTTTAEVTQARRHLDKSLVLWERTSGQHMQLLQRRDHWTPEDAQLFATLVSKEVETRRAMEVARAGLTTAEQQLSQSQLEYMNAMRKRYHEEQIWQDQWRVLGTFGTWSLIVLNSIVFLASQFFHNRRETQKIKAIETLIIEKLTSPSATSITTGTSTSTTKETDQAAPDAKDDKEEEIKDETIKAVEIREASSGVEPSIEQPRREVPEWLQKLQQKELFQKVRSKSANVVADVDVPSAILGASMTGMAVLVAMAVSSKR
jgi:hypothetical protein